MPTRTEVRSPSLALASLSLLWWMGCTGCAGFLNPAAERSIGVSGQIANVPPLSSCTARLVASDGRVAGEITVRPDFRRSFVVAPGDAKYSVEVTCAGSQGSFRSPTYELKAGRNEIQLGTIELR